MSLQIGKRCLSKFSFHFEDLIGMNYKSVGPELLEVRIFMTEETTKGELKDHKLIV